MDQASGKSAVEHFESLGMRTRLLSEPRPRSSPSSRRRRIFGLLIAWAQEVERYCDRLGQDYNEVVSFYEEIKYLLPSNIFRESSVATA